MPFGGTRLEGFEWRYHRRGFVGSGPFCDAVVVAVDPIHKAQDILADIRSCFHSAFDATDLLLVKMSSISNKIFRTANAPAGAPTETETVVVQAILDLEANVPELKAELRPLQISAAKEVDVKGGKKAIVIFVPMPQLKAFHKIQQR